MSVQPQRQTRSSLDNLVLDVAFEYVGQLRVEVGHSAAWTGLTLFQLSETQIQPVTCSGRSDGQDVTEDGGLLELLLPEIQHLLFPFCSFSRKHVANANAK